MYLGARDTSAVSGDAQLAALIANLGSRSTKFSIRHSITCARSMLRVCRICKVQGVNIPSFPSSCSSLVSKKKKKEKKSIELERVAFVESSIFDTNNLVCVVA